MWCQPPEGDSPPPPGCFLPRLCAHTCSVGVRAAAPPGTTRILLPGIWKLREMWEKTEREEGEGKGISCRRSHGWDSCTALRKELRTGEVPAAAPMSRCREAGQKGPEWHSGRNPSGQGPPPRLVPNVFFGGGEGGEKRGGEDSNPLTSLREYPRSAPQPRARRGRGEGGHSSWLILNEQRQGEAVPKKVNNHL